MTISKERLEQIEAIPDKEIDYTDIAQTDEAFWEKAELRMPQPKKASICASTKTCSTG